MSSKTIELFRGDSLPSTVLNQSSANRGRTFANHFCGNGLLARFADGGSSSLLEDKELLDYVLAHVSYERKTPEFARHSPLISFSKSRDTAFKFTNRRQRELEECTFDLATHFLWRFNFPLGEMLEVGRYGFVYQSDPQNCRELVRKWIDRGMRKEAETGDMKGLAEAVSSLGGMWHSHCDTSNHYAEVIDVYTFVSNADSSSRNEQLVKNTLERSKRDQEWLVYPKDPMPDRRGYSARLTMNKHLSVDSCYRRKEN